jgi:hypothetical protein
VTDTELIALFEHGETAPEGFHHSDHVRLAFAYLREYPALIALSKFSEALKRFAASRGKTQLYHETVTCAFFFLINERMARCESTSWDEFASRNSDLMIWKNGILSHYYEEATLKSDLARRAFVLPDKSLNTANNI